jgi:hypothetical protein
VNQRNNYTKVDRLLRQDKLSLREICLKTGMAFSTVAWRRKALGIKKQHLQKWTAVQVKWLKALCPLVGDYEIALMFSEAYPKEKGWTLKHIEKKRNYLGLRRTKAQLKAIKERNKAFGCWRVGSLHTWQTRGQMELGAVRKWDNGHQYQYEVVKTKNGFVRLSRHTWEKHYGEIPKAVIVAKKDPAKGEGDIENLELISRPTLALRNRLTVYPMELRDTIITLNQLKKTIYEKQSR